VRVIRSRHRHARTSAAVIAVAPAVLYLALLYFKTALGFLLPGGILEYLNIVVLAVGVLTLVFRFFSRVPWPYGREVCWSTLFMLVVAFSSISNASAPHMLGSTLYEAGSLLVIYVLFATTALNNNGLRAICVTLTLCAAANSTVALWGTVTHQTLFHATREVVGVGAFGYDATSGRSGGFVGENYAGMYDLPAIIGGFALLTCRKWRLVAFGLVFLGIAGTAVSVSRASFMSCIVAILVFICLAAHRLKLRTTLWIALFAALTILVGALGYTKYVSALDPRFQRMVTARFSESGVENDPRADLLRIYSRDILASPFLGKGAGYIKGQILSGAYVYVPHNSLIDIAVEFGVLALGLFSVALLRVIRAFRSALQDVHVSYLYACFFGMFVSLLTLSNPFARLIWALGGALLGAWRAQCWARAERNLATYGCAVAPRLRGITTGPLPEFGVPTPNCGINDPLRLRTQPLPLWQQPKLPR
jgi:hypothetical protein